MAVAFWHDVLTRIRAPSVEALAKCFGEPEPCFIRGESAPRAAGREGEGRSQRQGGRESATLAALTELLFNVCTVRFH